MDVTEFLRLAAASHLLLLCVILLKDHHERRVAVATSIFGLLVICHLALPVTLASRAPQVFTDMVFLAAVAVPPGFWLLTRWYFDDEFSPSLLLLWPFLAFEAVQYVGWILTDHGSSPPRPPFGPAWMLLAKLLAAGVVVNALVRVMLGRRSDLVAARLRLRYVVLVVSGGYVLAVLIAEGTLAGASAARPLDLLNAAAMYGLVFIFSTLWFGIRPDFLRALPPTREPAAAPALDARLLERLRHLVEVDQVYKEEGLTISELARRLGVSEPKARQLINVGLGFRNFNAYLHALRIARATEMLADGAQQHLNIAEVAYALGYNSLGPFNKAFREITGKTPTEFRRERVPTAPGPTEA